MKTLLLAILLLPIVCSGYLMAQEPDSQVERAADLIRGRQYAVAAGILGGDPATLAAEAPDFTGDEVLLLRARALHLDGKHAEAEAACDELLAGFPEGAWRHKAKFLKAHALAARGRYEEALAIYEAEASRLFSEERKDEVARSLIGFAAMFAKVPDPSDLEAPKPDYQKAYQLYKEVLDVQCSAALREEAHFAMIRMNGHLQAWDTVLIDALSYLQTYDPSWRGEMDSRQRLTFQDGDREFTPRDESFAENVSVIASGQVSRRPKLVRCSHHRETDRGSPGSRLHDQWQAQRLHDFRG